MLSAPRTDPYVRLSRIRLPPRVSTANWPYASQRLCHAIPAQCPADDRPRMAGEEALWYYKRGAARTALGHSPDAELDLRKALAFEGRKWVHGRAHLELGRLLLQAGRPAAAISELRTAISLCEEDGDPLAAEEARSLLP